jgi:two-component system CheB/CheR fusion protein
MLAATLYDAPMSLKVLVADDDPCVAASLIEILRREGHTVRGAHSGAYELRESRAFRPDVLLLDIVMPGLSGYGVASALKRELGGRAPRLIALTGWKEPTNRLLSDLAGFDHYFSKPYDPRAVLAAIAGR